MNHRSLRACSAGVIGLLSFSIIHAEPLRYRAIVLENLPHGSTPAALNNRGWVVATVWQPRADVDFVATLYVDGTQHYLLPLVPGEAISPADINERGDIVGNRFWPDENDQDYSTPFAVIDGEIVNLPSDPVFATPASAINNRREIVGTVADFASNYHAGIGWKITSQGPVDLPISDQISWAIDINDSGTIVGSSEETCYLPGFGWRSLKISVLQYGSRVEKWADTECEHSTGFVSINNRNEVLQTDMGVNDTYENPSLISREHGRIDLSLPDFLVRANTINNAGTVVGFRSDYPEADGLIWDGSGWILLQDISAGAEEFDIRSGEDINDVNQIVAFVRRYDSFNISHSVLLTPLDLTLAAPLPGIAGTRNALYLAGATQGQDVLFFYAASPGSTALPGCDNLFLDLADPILIGRDDASPTTNAWLDVDIPAAARGRTLYLQAFEPSTCRISNRVEVMLR